jgi:hypothetical protein
MDMPKYQQMELALNVLPIVKLVLHLLMVPLSAQNVHLIYTHSHLMECVLLVLMQHFQTVEDAVLALLEKPNVWNVNLDTH